MIMQFTELSQTLHVLDTMNMLYTFAIFCGQRNNISNFNTGDTEAAAIKLLKYTYSI